MDLKSVGLTWVDMAGLALVASATVFACVEIAVQAWVWIISALEGDASSKARSTMKTSEPWSSFECFAALCLALHVPCFAALYCAGLVWGTASLGSSMAVSVCWGLSVLLVTPSLNVIRYKQRKDGEAPKVGAYVAGMACAVAVGLYGIVLSGG